MARRDSGSLDQEIPANGSGTLGRSAPPVPAVVLIAVLAIGFLAALASPVLRSPPEAELWDGSWTAAVEEELLEGSALRSVATTTWGALDLLVFRQGLPGVLVGRDGWLFTTEEFAPGEVAERFTTESPVAEIRSAATRLEADGVDLQVVLIPAKARVHEEALGRYRLPEAAEARYGVLKATLQEAGVDVVDGAAAMAGASGGESLFLRTDTHWTPAGARAVAARVAERIEARHAGSEWLGAHSYDLEADGETQVEGDLLAFVPLGPLAGAVGPEPDRVTMVHAVQTGGEDGGILGDVHLPVTLVGTSYSADPRWGFADALRAGLGSDVLVAADEGAGPFDPMWAYLEGEAYRTSRPDVVVWEIPERYAWPELGWGER